MTDLATKKDGNPYLLWIEMYGGSEYLDVMHAAIVQLDRLAESRFNDARFDDLSKTFRQATLLEVNFWQMGLNALR